MEYLQNDYTNFDLLAKNNNDVITLDTIRKKTKYLYLETSKQNIATLIIYYNTQVLYKFENHPISDFKYILHLLQTNNIKQI